MEPVSQARGVAAETGPFVYQTHSVQDTKLASDEAETR